MIADGLKKLLNLIIFKKFMKCFSLTIKVEVAKKFEQKQIIV